MARDLEQDRQDVQAELEQARRHRSRLAFPPPGGLVGDGTDRERERRVLDRHIARLERILEVEA